MSSHTDPGPQQAIQMTEFYFDDYAYTSAPYDWSADERPAHARLLLLGALLILALQGVDWGTTHVLLAHGYKELNPLAAALIALGWLLALKAGLAAILAWRVARQRQGWLSRRLRPTNPLGLLLAVYTCVGAYLTVALGNIFGLIR